MTIETYEKAFLALGGATLTAALLVLLSSVPAWLLTARTGVLTTENSR